MGSLTSRDDLREHNHLDRQGCYQYLLFVKHFLSALFLCACPLANAAPIDPESHDAKPVVPEIAAAGYRLVFSDEFNGTALDTEKWNYRTDSKGLSTQLAANVSVSGGTLHLKLKKESAQGKNYTGAGVISKQTFKYGYYEARFKVPPGAGWHTSFWTMRSDGAGGTAPGAAKQEIDICEQDSVKLTGYSAGVIDWSPRMLHQEQVGHGRTNLRTPDLSADFHTWGCEFTPAEVKFFFDGKLTHQTDAAGFAHGDQNIWLTSIGYKAGGKLIDDSKLPADAEFDYIRFYEKAAAAPAR